MSHENELVKEARDALASQHRRRTDEATKEAVKEALKEWLDDKFAEVGKWTIRGIMAMAFAGSVYLFLVSNGWHKG